MLPGQDDGDGGDDDGDDEDGDDDGATCSSWHRTQLSSDRRLWSMGSAPTSEAW